MADAGTRRTTITDVGRLAGVSAKTVSRVLNDAPYVSAAIKLKVRAAADALNYHPNVFAQGLVRRRSHLVGLIYENPSPGYVVDLQTGVLDRLAGSRFRLVVIPVRMAQDDPREIVGLIRSAALDGVVLAPPLSDDPLVLERLVDAGIRCARVGHSQQVGASGTLDDDAAAARAIAAHVVALGHRRIAVILGDPTHGSCAMRLRGYRDALDEAGLALPPHRIAQGRYTFESGVAAAQALLDQAEPPTAILAQNDDMAVGAMTAAHARGLVLPRDLSVVGFDDSQVARLSWPRLTTIRQPVFEMAASAAGLLIDLLEGREPTREGSHPYRLVLRESTAPPPDQAMEASSAA